MVGARQVAGGKIVMVVNLSVPRPYDHIGLARFNADGSFDASFGQGGQATGTLTTQPSLQVLGPPNEARAFAVQADGKIVVAGYATSSGTDSGAVVMRFNANGSLDTAFGDNGRRLIAFQANDATVANAVAVLGDGTVVVAGTAPPAGPSDQDYFVARFSSSGAPDTVFSPTGAT